ncbi:hypothetical protein SO802_014342 [Lithocarpus litseifolius]|uniref:DUF4283 domain-containing protein n=1 Tax=Lithocarpus litseifolius TaxID=425828 RepID=A0AAW2CVV1_9ROSI
MDEELEELWKKLSFTEEKDKGIELGSGSTKAAKERGKNCAVLKVLTQRSISVDALRKNMRMMWKVNKGVQISEIEEDLFLVEFGDGRDKKKVLNMCPWSNKKQLVLIQDFEVELAPREIDLKRSPFWVQMFNLPLRSRMRETGEVIGSKLGTVLEVDVFETGVHWGKCLRMRIRFDVTKILVRGKQVTIEGGKSRWINFKYEWLPNFYYNCGLLSHALKDCLNSSEIPQQKISDLQYAWLRGEPIRRGFKDLTRSGMEKEGDERSWEGGVRLEKPSEARKKTVGGKEHVPRLTSRDGDNLTWIEAK